MKHFWKLGRALGFAGLSILFSSTIMQGQVTTATLVGSITDTSGAVVPDAKVTVTNLQTNQPSAAAANAEGQYRVELLPVGTYTVTIEAPGFKKFVQSNIVLTVNQVVRVDAALTVGALNDTVTVSAEPPQINLENAAVGFTVESRQVNSLPIVDRNIYSLLPLTPGVQNQQNGNTLGYIQEVVQINGGTTSNNNGTVSYYLDGGLNMTALRNTGNIMPNPEAIDEFNVQTSNYNATYGRMSSGVVNVITHSGTNQFDGSVYEFNRNTDFNATPFLGVGKSPLHRNMFGGVLGGPIVKNRTFFFGEYGGLRQVTSTQVSGAILPTPAEVSGDFSAFLPTSSGTITSCTQNLSAADKSAGHFIVCNPTSRKPFANNKITGPLDPTAQSIMTKYLPAANVNAGSLAPGFSGYISQPLNTNEYMGKIDHQLSTRQRIDGMYFYTSGSQTIQAGTGNIPWAYQQQKWTQQNVNLSHTFTISSNKINQTWFTYTRIFGGRFNTPQTALSSLGSNLAVQGPPNLSQITVTGYFTLSNTIGGPVAGTNFYSARDLLILNKGNHSVTFGGEFSLNKDIQQTLLNNYGVFTFSGSTSARSGNALSDFVLGLQSAQTQDAPVTAIDNSFFYSAFVQDDWRLRPNLTINSGLRWDVQTSPTDPQNKESTFIAGRQSTVNPLMPPGVLVVGDAGVPRGTVPNRYQHFSPRLGFAWDPFRQGKTSVRASAGIFWGGVSGNEWNATSNFYPFSLRYTFPVVGTLTNPYLNSPSPFPYVYTPGKVQPIVKGGSVEGAAPNFQWPYTYQLTASIQQQITNNLMIGVAYVGSLARNISFSQDINYPIFNTSNPASNTTSNVINRRPIDTGVLGQILQVQSSQTANYNALQFTFAQRVTHGVSFSGFYAFSKTLDSTVLDSSTAPEDYNNLKLEKGPSNFDQRNTFVASVVWQPNYFQGGNRFASTLLNDWSLSGIVKLSSGVPYNITTGADNNLDGNTTDRPVQTGQIYDPNVNRSSRSQLINEYFNPNSFCGYSVTAPTACPGAGPGGSDGTLQRNAYPGPGHRDVDMALFRDFKIVEQLRLQGRAEAVNVFNLVNLGPPNGTLSSSNHAKITGGDTNYPMREIQLGLRLIF